MDPSSLNSHGFVNLLASQSSPPIDVDSAEAPVTSPGLVKPAERRKWSTKEDIVLISAWLNTSKDPIVCKFVGCHESALKEQASGQTENDVMKLAHDIYFNGYNVKFSLEHCWRELRFDQKWRSHCQPKDKRKESGPKVVAEEEEVRPLGVKASKAAKHKKPNEAAFDQIQSILAQKNTLSNKKNPRSSLSQKH
uniref:No apical meristem-associated C-terminal domain-containing protein n=1 Tax=Brassica oleracea TaxID=3712 RepID=A0A3P6EYR4_BRAOL|nr:unnamed protein product [Brassica oleracea]